LYTQSFKEDLSMAFSTPCQFRKARIKELGIRDYGRYRGNGTITINNDGIIIEGRHVFSLGARWGIAIIIAVASAIVTLGSVVLGIIPIYLLVEFAILKREKVTIAWDKLRKFAVDTKNHLISIDFVGPEWTSPAVAYFFSGFEQAVLALREKALDKDTTSHVQVTLAALPATPPTTRVSSKTKRMRLLLILGLLILLILIALVLRR
jgi:hypothetical protein